MARKTKNFKNSSEIYHGSVQPKALLDFAKTGATSDTLNGNPILRMMPKGYMPRSVAPNYYVVYKNGRVLAENNYEVTETAFKSIKSVNDFAAIELGVTPRKLKGYKHPMLLNGDDTINATSFDYGDKELPKISFACLRRLGGKQLLDNLISGRAEIVDFTVSESRKASAEQLATLKEVGPSYSAASTAARKLTPPSYGFVPELSEARSYVNQDDGYDGYKTTTHYKMHWHRIGAVLIKDTRKSGKIVYYYCGRDDGTYFGVELANEIPIRNIRDALNDLKPAAIRGVPASRYFRQGEWFFKKIRENKLPSVERCIAFYDRSHSPAGCFVLPVDDPESNHHVFRGCYRVTRKGEIFVGSGYVEHREHPTLELPEWYSVHKNTAVQAVSVEGVD